MFVITGALGQTGSAVVATLLESGYLVRMVVHHDDERAASWRRQGVSVAVADLSDEEALLAAFEGAEAAYLMNPPAYLAADLFSYARKVSHALVNAAGRAKLGRIVALSSIGGQQTSGTGNILTLHDFERQLRAFRGRCTILRAASFMENWASALPTAIKDSILPSMLLPLNRAFPMVSAKDIGRTAAQLLLENPSGNQIVELHGPGVYSAEDAARELSIQLEKHITAVAVPEKQWPEVFRALSFPKVTVQAFCEMYRGFNNGTVRFEGIHRTVKGCITLYEALADCVARMRNGRRNQP